MSYPVALAYGTKVTLSDNLKHVWEVLNDETEKVTTVREKGVEGSQPQLFPIVPECNLSAPTLSPAAPSADLRTGLLYGPLWKI